jgi:hypothetical protein
MTSGRGIVKTAVSRSLAIMIIGVALVLEGACCAITCPSPCSPETSRRSQTRIVDLSDGRPLARFDLTQTVTVGLGDCPVDDQATGAISLSITNMAAEPASFGYTVTNSGGDVSVWTYSGQVTLLAAGATVNVGLISNSVVPLGASVSVLVSR